MLSNRTNTLEINIERLWETLETSAKIGVGKTVGLSRLALSDDDKKMRDQFVAWCKEAGCTIDIDAVGNIFAKREGEEPDLPSIMVGSHLDTQIAGGRYDGILGVLSGLEVIRTLNDRDITTRRSVEAVCWTNEEGVRFQPPMMGAGTFAGIHDLDWVLAQSDDDGALFGSELTRIGYAGDAKRTTKSVDAYFELHIEQGPVLDAEKIDVGIVTGGFTSFGAEIIIKGENAHSGPTMMKQRKDALVGAALMVSKINEIGWAYEPEGRTTCARIDVSPNKYGIIADKAEIILDVRHPDAGQSAKMYSEILAEMPKVAQKSGVELHISREWSFGDIQFDKELTELVHQTAEQLDISHKKMLSAAGHDAYHLANAVPTAMIFTPCKDGITHNENEHIEPAYTAPGVNLLLNAVVQRANA